MIARRSTRPSRNDRASDSAAWACPVCRETDRVEKASSVVGQNSGTFYVGGTSLPHRFTTSLAVALSMPPAPLPRPWARVASSMIWSVLFAGVIGAAAYGISQIVDGGTSFRLGVMALLLCFGLVLPSYTLVRAVEERQSSVGRMSSWRLANSRWNRMYYCFRDDVVFLKGEGDCEPPASMSRLLYPSATPVTGTEAVVVTEPVSA